MEEIQSLENLWRLRPALFPAGMRAMENVRQQDANTLQQSQLAQQQTLQQIAGRKQEMEQNAALNPMLQREAQLRLDNLENPQYKADEFQKVLESAAAMANAPGAVNPGLAPLLKRHMRNLYNPAMDNMPPDQIPGFLNGMLDYIAKNNAKQQGAMALQGVKNEGAAERERIRAQAAARVAEIRRQIAVANAGAAKERSPKTWQELAVKYAELARNAFTAEEYSEFVAAANNAAAKAQELAATAATARAATQPDMGAMGVPTNPQPAPVPVTPPRPASAAQGATPPAPAPAPASNERVRVISPNGETGTIPKSQLQQAIAQGFKEVK